MKDQLLIIYVYTVFPSMFFFFFNFKSLNMTKFRSQHVAAQLDRQTDRQTDRQAILSNKDSRVGPNTDYDYSENQL